MKGNRVEIGKDIALNPFLERAFPGERQIEFFAVFRNQGEAEERSAPAVIFGVEEVPQR